MKLLMLILVLFACTEQPAHTPSTITTPTPSPTPWPQALVIAGIPFLVLESDGNITLFGREVPVSTEEREKLKKIVRNASIYVRPK